MLITLEKDIYIHEHASKHRPKGKTFVAFETMAIPSRTFDSIEGNEREREDEGWRREGEGNSGCDLMVAEGDPRLQPEGLARIHSHISGPWLIVGTKQASGM